ncbi:MAG TPA: iron uptake transporter permease EfeU [Dongiaceae bacterium]|jgi:high-affinity iron transporter
MFIAFLIMLREGIEAALIVGIAAGYLKQTGATRLMPAIWIGTTSAALICLVAGIALNLASAEFPQREQELFEAFVGFAAVAILISMVFWMRKAARSLKSNLQNSIDAAIHDHGHRGFALVGIAFFAVAREGLESVFFLLAAFQQSKGLAVPLGALGGLLLAITVGYAIYQGGARLNLRVFFRWTGVFILFVASGLMAGSLRSLHEAGIWNGLQATAFDLSGVLPADGLLGSLLAGLLGYHDTPSTGEVLVYFALLLPALFFFFSDRWRPGLANPTLANAPARPRRKEA